MPQLPPDYPGRFELADEVHARPPEPLELPSRATYVAVMVDPTDRDSERAHIVRLFEAFAVVPPDAGLTQFSAQLGPLRIKWERHGEFSGYVFLLDGLSPTPFTEPATTRLPAGWLEAIPGQTIVAAHAKLVAGAQEVPDPQALADHFGGNIVVGSSIGEGAGYAFTDFKIHADGCARFLLMDRGLTPRQAGRMLQRLLEIEAYRMLALLALPMAREQLPRIVQIERSLETLTGEIAREGADEERLLQELTRTAAEIEHELTATQYRFGATRAYAELVRTRIAELREVRIAGTQTIEEFMARRFTPAVATCNTVSQRLHELADRVAQASGLLATRVGIAREKQNQALLASMNRRAQLQLRLQKAVEGLSMAAIVYYAAGLVGYVVKGGKAAGLPLDPELIVGLSIPLLAGVAYLVLRRARRHLATSERNS
ncbi:DUF3422 family protein [Rubrivivax gelatinosus]|uniref:Putative membrane-anchored protein n=1 Tax=Rubrivivax gelatinosus TaxID=28068 RepID=A0A4R2M325_RUBGE|nr:DUF3422 domain-containing protein [Rubrivivax gelatinosus]MBK1689730.1 hypothetical protein [Rubrivivax gelatinosus]TCP01529.1 putative membrane-anchored protein [Rubrivivax gelatinosus]